MKTMDDILQDFDVQEHSKSDVLHVHDPILVLTYILELMNLVI